ncbi:TRAP transporter substrate-binding protein [Magnetospira sp. QH-2]|uniref:TRAP transporter substrate-binding protein n=1 Tax=Magnetospira sp. (strain QH-2) TaxID=1288970 RepID=UPI0003E80E19|nr:TRAP transporter substrate-binding protein [Magnetospira sp. QH-2]CCQ74525.1 TRAP dicarboxylate transporter periplasmic substrate binding subunit-DctP subunit [Magnetospira sp. QH-2]
MIKRLTMTAIAGLVALTTGSQPVQAADVTLRFAHFWPAVAGTHKHLFQVWADAVEKDSNGRIKVEIYPSATLAKPPAQYDAVKNRIADVTATVLGYTANRFPLAQVVEVPGLVKDAAHGSCILQGIYDEGHLDKEFKDTKPLFLFTHGPGHVHTSKKLIKEPKDFAGLRIRRPTTLVGSMLEKLGAQPVGMPAPQSYQSMQRGVIDGVTLPWEGQLVFRLNELATKHTEVGGLYTLAFVVTMNKDVYNSMPADLKKVIDKNSGKDWAAKAAVVFDDLDVKGRAAAEQAGHEFHVVEGGIENPAWKPILAATTKDYIDGLDGKGLAGSKVHARAMALAASCQ